MNREDIIKMAREACIYVSENNSFADDMYISTLYRFAKLVAAAEREACAQLAEDEWSYFSTECGSDVAKDIAASIRARGQE